MGFRMDRSVAGLNEPLELNVAVRNDSSSVLTALKIQLQQECHWSAHGEHEKMSRTIVSMVLPWSEFGKMQSTPGTGSGRGQSVALWKITLETISCRNSPLDLAFGFTLSFLATACSPSPTRWVSCWSHPNAWRPRAYGHCCLWCNCSWLRVRKRSRERRRWYRRRPYRTCLRRLCNTPLDLTARRRPHHIQGSHTAPRRPCHIQTTTRHHTRVMAPHRGLCRICSTRFSSKCHTPLRWRWMLMEMLRLICEHRPLTIF